MNNGDFSQISDQERHRLGCIAFQAQGAIIPAMIEAKKYYEIVEGKAKEKAKYPK